MRIAVQQLKDFLLDSGLLSKEKVEEAIVKATEAKQELGQYLLEAELLKEAELQKVYAYVLGIPFVDLSKETIPLEILQVVPEPIAKKSNIVSFEKEGNNLKVAMLNPEDLQTLDFIKKKTSLRIVPCLTTRESIQTALRQYEKSLKAEFGDILTGEIKPGDPKKDEENAEALAAGLPIIRIVDTLLKHAILQSASDIHIEPIGRAS